MGPASLSVLTSAAVDALVPLHFQLPPMRYFLPSKAACGAPGGPPAPKKACIFDCGARAARSRGDSGRAPRGWGRAGPTWPPDPLAWLGSASGAAPLSSRARPGKKSVARVINTGAHDERSHGVKRGRRAVCERLVERCAAWQLDVAKAARPAPQRATSAHLEVTLLFDRSSLEAVPADPATLGRRAAARIERVAAESGVAGPYRPGGNTIQTRSYCPRGFRPRFLGHPIFFAARLFHHDYQRVPLIATHIQTSCKENRGAIRTKARSKVVLESYCPPVLC